MVLTEGGEGEINKERGGEYGPTTYSLVFPSVMNAMQYNC